MSRFDTDFLAGAWEDLVDLAGITVSYDPRAGPAVTLTGVWDRDRTIANYLPTEEQNVEYGVLRLSKVFAPDPRRGDTVTIQGQTWSVAGIGARTPVVELQLERRVTASVRDQQGRLPG